jgi:spore germination protein
LADEKRNRFEPKITIPLLTVALLASLAWGYSQYRSKRSWEIKAENQYNKSFSELATHVGELETQLTKVMVSNSRPNLVKNFSDIWRQAYLSQEDMGQLPLTSVELAKTKEFLAKVGAFSFNTVTRLNKDENQKNDQDGKNIQYLTQKDWETLQGLHRQARYLSGQLINLQERMLEAGEKWTGVERIATTSMVADVSKRLENNKITKSFMMMEDGFERLPEPEMEGNLLNFKPVPKGITGQEISVEQAREIARDYIDQGTTRYGVNYEGQIKGDYPLYLFRLVEEDEKGKERKGSALARIAVTGKGGHVAWMLKERGVAKSNISLEQAKEKARTYLENRNYQGMTPVGVEDFRNIALVSLCRTAEQTVVYPEMIKVQVALDDGEILGTEAMSYLTFHDPKRTISAPRLSEVEIKKRLNNHLKVEQIKKAVILNDHFQEILAYECDGILEQERFRIFVNATTGEEERIQRMNAQGVEIK